jgi:hypothetical protein
MQILLYASEHLFGIVALCAAQGWPNYRCDPERADCFEAPSPLSLSRKVR